MDKIHWKKVFDSNYLGACDLEPGQDLTATIKSVVIGEVKNSDGKKQNRNIAHFTDEKIKPMVLNATNCRQIKKFTNSPFITDWNNVKITIYVKDDIRAFGDITEGLRIRDKQPAAKLQLTPGTENWNKVIAYIQEGGKISEVKKKYDISEQDEKTLIG